MLNRTAIRTRPAAAVRAVTVAGERVARGDLGGGGHGGSSAYHGPAGPPGYLVYGDTRIIKRHYDGIAAWVEFLSRRCEG